MSCSKRSLRAVSPVVAVLMMIAIAVVGSLVVYGWFMGYISFNTGSMTEAIKIQSIGNDGDNLVVYVQNLGRSAVQFDEYGCLYVDGILGWCSISDVPVSGNIATVGEGYTATLTCSGGSTYPGEKVTVKVTTLRGTSSEGYAYPAGSIRVPPVLDHFEFDPIASPQIVDVPFNVTIRAISQYDQTFTGYVGVNNLSISSGAAVPSETGNFLNGIWTGQVNVTELGNSLTLSTVAQSNPECTGTSNTFNVVSAVGWLDGWGCRKSHVIENATGAGSGYQVMIHVYKGQQADTGGDVYLDYDKCRDDFGDIRFTGSNGTSLLPYWMESVTPGSDALFWVKVTEDLSTQNQTIYLYYDNPQETSLSSGDATFVYFDDFTGTTISDDLTLFINDTDHARIYLDTVNDMLVGEKVGAKQTIWDSAVVYFPQVEPGHAIRTSCLQHVDDPQGNTRYVIAFDGTLYYPPVEVVGTISYCRDEATVNRIGYTFVNHPSSETPYTVYTGVRELDTWQIIDVYWDYNYGEVLLDGVSIGSTDNASMIPTTPLYPSIGLEAGADVGHTENHFDWVVVRKYVQTEPAHGVWGEEENWSSS